MHNANHNLHKQASKHPSSNS